MMSPVLLCKFIWKTLGYCNNNKRHLPQCPCNSNIPAMVQHREHSGKAHQYCGNTCCGNVERHCKQHGHSSNIVAIRALPQWHVAMRWCVVPTLQQRDFYRQLYPQAPRFCDEVGFRWWSLQCDPLSVAFTCSDARWSPKHCRHHLLSCPNIASSSPCSPYVATNN